MNKAYDYESCARIWKRVSPELEPYPEADGPALSLPGAEEDPCCMGSEAAASVDVLRGFLNDARRDCRAFARCAARSSDPVTRRTLRMIAQSDRMHAKKLSAALYLITGERERTDAPEAAPCGDDCGTLRRLYHRKACGGYNYARAAQEALDPCLQKLLSALSEEAYRHAERLLELLARKI